MLPCPAFPSSVAHSVEEDEELQPCGPARPGFFFWRPPGLFRQEPARIFIQDLDLRQSVVAFRRRLQLQGLEGPSKASWALMLPSVFTNFASS